MLTPVGTIDASRYLRIGLALMAVKYAVDAGLIYAWTGLIWTPLDYVLSLASLSGAKAARLPSTLSFILFVWTIPFSGLA